MATQTVTCASCGMESTIDAPGDGMQLVWECALKEPTGPVDEATGTKARVAGDGCGARNVLPGTHPAELVQAEATAPPGAVAVGDGEAAASGETHQG